MDVTIPSEVQAEMQTVSTMLAALEALPVTTLAEYERAGEEIKTIAARRKSLEAERVKIKAPIIAAGKAVDALFAPPLDLCDRARKVVETKMLGYQREQQRIREEAERQAAEASRRERERMEREAAAEREKARKAEAAALEKARLAEEAGRHEKAEQMRLQAAERAAAAQAEADAKQAAAAAMPTAPVVHMEAPKAQGTSVRRTFDYEITDAALLPREYLLPDEVRIGKVVRALGEAANIPGVRVIVREGMAVRG